MKQYERIQKLAESNLPEYTPEELERLERIEVLKKMAEIKPDIAADLVEKDTEIIPAIEEEKKRRIVRDKLQGMMRDSIEMEEGEDPMDIGREMRRRRYRRMMEK